MKIWTGIVSWLRGKKTILGGGAMILAAVAGIWYGKLDPVTGLALAGAGFSAVGWADKANRHQAELLTVLKGVGKVGAEVRSGNTQQAAQDAKAMVEGLAPLAIGTALGSTNLHISGSSAEEVADLVQRLLQHGALTISTVNSDAVKETLVGAIRNGVSAQ